MIHEADTIHFCDLIRRKLGLHFDRDKFDFVSGVLEQRAGGKPSSYLSRIDADEWRALAEELTVTETFFFRNPAHFDALLDVVGPQANILSAGCASGEEPYSIAIVLKEHRPTMTASIRAIDMNPAMLRKAARGAYTPWALRETPASIRQKYFSKDQVLSESIRNQVHFEERNLLDADLGGGLDVIFCRNVIMYFSPEAMRAVVAKMAEALNPGGYLFLGHAETLRGLSQQFHLCHTHDTFYYQRRPGRVPEVRPEPITIPEPSADWMDVIRNASERIETLSKKKPRPPAPKSPPAEIGIALQLLRQERFAEAHEMLKNLPDPDADGQLLLAVVAANCGDLEGAEKTCLALLRGDELNAGAHYLVALCRESAGDRKASIEHDQTAVYLDPTFAMPHFHLGRLARRAGDRETAGRELDQALALFAREDASRILLFGGGFSRESLIQLCRAELKACRS